MTDDLGSASKGNNAYSNPAYHPIRGYFNWTREVAKEAPLAPDAADPDQDDDIDEPRSESKFNEALREQTNFKNTMPFTKPTITQKPPIPAAATAAAAVPVPVNVNVSKLPHISTRASGNGTTDIKKDIASAKSPASLEEPALKRPDSDKAVKKEVRISSGSTLEAESKRVSPNERSRIGSEGKVLGLTQKMDVLNNKDFQYTETARIVANTAADATKGLDFTKGAVHPATKRQYPAAPGTFGKLDADFNATVNFEVGNPAYGNMPSLPVTGHLPAHPMTAQSHVKPLAQVAQPQMQVQPQQPATTSAAAITTTTTQPYHIPMMSITKQSITQAMQNQPTMAGETRSAIAVPKTRQNSEGAPGPANYANDPEYKKAMDFIEKNKGNLSILFRKLPIQMLYVNKSGYFAFEKIGTGGYGVVYKALQPNGQLCAIKIMSTQKSASDYNKLEEETNYRAMMDEIEIMLQLKGRGICLDILDYEILIKQGANMRRIALIVMELGDTDLRSFMKGFKPPKEDRMVGPGNPCNLLPESKILSLLYDMITVLHGMHMQGYIHCDLKPQNFMFHKGRLKLIDFGISKAMQQNTTCAFTDTIAGTPKYMAPEIMPTLVDPSGNRKTELHRVADVWSIGCILFEMAAGYHPLDRYVDKHILSLLKVVADRKYTIEADDLHVSPELRELIMACLEHSPNKRITMKGIFAHACLKHQFSSDMMPEF